MTENLDAMRAIEHIELDDRELFKEALAATLVKHHRHRRSFDTVFDVYFSLFSQGISTDADGRVTGLVTLACLRNVPPRLRSQTPVGAVAIPLAEVPRATPEEPAAALLERLPPGGRALVFEGDRLVGIVTWTDIARTMEIRDIVGTTEPPKRPGSTGPRH